MYFPLEFAVLFDADLEGGWDESESYFYEFVMGDGMYSFFGDFKGGLAKLWVLLLLCYE